MPPHESSRSRNRTGRAAGREAWWPPPSKLGASRNVRSTWRPTPGSCSPRPASGSPAAVGPGIDLPVQFHAGFTFRDAARDRPLPARPRHHPLLRLALPQGRARAARTATTSPTTAAQPGDRHRGRLCRVAVGPARARAGPDPRHRAQPHGDPRQREPLVERRAGERPGLALRRLLRHRLAGLDRARELQDRVLLPVLGEPYGEVLERGELRLGLRGRRVPRPVLTTTASRSTRAATRAILEPAVERASARWAPRTTAVLEYQSILTAVRNLPDRTETEPGPRGRAAAREGGHQAAARDAWSTRQPADRRGFVEQIVAALQRHAGRPAQLRPARRAARRAGLPAGVLAGRPRRDQLPPLLRHQRPGRPEHGARGGLRGHPRPDPRAAGRGQASTACASTTPTACSTPGQYLERLQEHFVLAVARRLHERGPASRGRRLGRRRAAAPRAHRPTDRPGRRTASPAVRRRREDPRLRRGAARRLGDARHQRLRLPQPVNGLFVDPGARDAVHAAATTSWIGDDTPLPRDGLPEEAPDPARCRWPASCTCWPTSSTGWRSSDRRSRDFTLQRPAARAARGDRLLPGLPLLHHRRTASDEPDRRYVERAVRRAMRRNPLISRRIFRFIRDMLCSTGSGVPRDCRRTSRAAPTSPASSSR